MIFVSLAYKPGEEINDTISIREKLISFTTFILIFVSIFALEYITWTSVGNSIIGGVQGRCFIPIAPLFFLLFYNGRININKKGINWLVIIFTLITLSISLYVIIKRFYIL
jgi:uncharacterized membrane protein